MLSASSAYFSAMFTGSLRETQQEEITLGDVNGDALQQLVQYCYTGKCVSFLIDFYCYLTLEYHHLLYRRAWVFFFCFCD